jgi:ABC-type transport system involved in cytochrome c biogenesis permease subunit
MMKRILIALYIGMVAVLAAATVLERLYGSTYAEANIYHSLWFCLYWGLLAAGTVGVFCQKVYRKRWAVTGLHLAFIVILGGALITFLTARKGLVHLPEGEPVREYLSENTGRYHQLPFTLQLDSFRIVYDPVSDCPADYVSYVRLDGQSHRIQMNRILSERGIRLYQSSYDDDERGSWLSLNCDPWGIPLTYLGYALLALTWLGLLLRPRESFRRLSGKRLRAMVVLSYVIVLGITYGVFQSKSATLMPVLRSGWFVSHVSLVSTAYALLFATWVISLIALCTSRRKPQWEPLFFRTNQALLYPAVALLTAGIFVGAVWANVSWGRYWGWDPKEVWALITLMIYAIPLHRTLLPSFQRPVFFQAYLIIAFLTVLATYFGVNMLLGGMHSYA